MSLCTHTSRIYIDEYDLIGLLNAMQREIEESQSQQRKLRLEGAREALFLIANCDFRDQAVFLAAFNTVLEEKEGRND